MSVSNGHLRYKRHIKQSDDTYKLVSHWTSSDTVEMDDNSTLQDTVDNINDQLGEKAPLDSPSLTGTPTAPTAVTGTNTTQVATTEFVRGEISALVNGAPETMDTLNELADAIAEHQDVTDALNAAIGNKVDKVEGKGLSTNDYTNEDKAQIEANTTAISDLNARMDNGDIGDISKIYATKEELDVVDNVNIFSKEFSNGWNAGGVSGSSTFNSVEFINGRFIGVAGSGTTHYSQDGVNWTEGGLAGTAVLYAIAYGNGMYVTVGGTSNTGGIHYSTDGINWTSTDIVANTIMYGVAFGKGKFIAVGAGVVYESVDGINWTLNSASAGTATQRDIAFGNNVFVIAGHNGAYYSVNGTTWNACTSCTTKLFGVTYANNLFIAVGTSGKVYTSKDGKVWTGTTVGSTTLRATAYANGVYFIVGEDGATYYSTDTTNWTSIGGCSVSLYDVAYGDGKFVAVSGSGKTFYVSQAVEEVKTIEDSINDLYTKCEVLPEMNDDIAALDTRITTEKTYSANTYQPKNIDVEMSGLGFNDGATIGSGNLYRIAYGNSVVVAVGSEGLFYSKNYGKAWTRASLNDASLMDVTYGTFGSSEAFVAVSGKGNVYRSTDGVNWIEFATVNAQLYGVTISKNIIIVVGQNCIAYYNTSSDPDFVKVSNISGTLTAVTYKNEQVFVAVGDSGVTYYSVNGGTTWTRKVVDSTQTFAGIAFKNGRFVAVSNSGKSFQTNDGITWSSAVNIGKVIYGICTTPLVFIAVGQYGYAFVSTTGSSWTAFEKSASTQLNGAVYCEASGEVIAVGTQGYSAYSNLTTYTSSGNIETVVTDHTEQLEEHTTQISELNTNLSVKTGTFTPADTVTKVADLVLKKQGNMVFFNAHVQGTFTASAYTPIGVMPEGFRPTIKPSLQIISSQTQYGANTALEVLPDGTTRVYQYGTTSTTWLYISVCYFVG